VPFLLDFNWFVTRIIRAKPKLQMDEAFSAQLHMTAGKELRLLFGRRRNMENVPREIQKLSYSIAEAVELTGLGRSTIYEEIRSKRLLARKIGRRTIVLAEDLSSFLASLPLSPAE
jgi:excisionase family DNA binding protein